ncbi:MAG: 2-amino-4-hydroxy-6-hydroxymethyldihydropteridine diphosphokinase [Gemmatimonadota bacterium]
MAGEPACFNPPIPADVLIALGTNLGDRAGNLRAALAALSRFADIDAVSRVYETEPIGFRDQPVYWNLVVRAHTSLEPVALFRALKQVEQEMGRRETFRNAPRVIDLDLIAYDELVLRTATLEIPHPRMHERTFVLYPLAEVAPSFRHPESGHDIDQLIRELGAPSRAIALEDALAEKHE